MPDKAFTSQMWLCPPAWEHPHICTWVAVSRSAPPWRDLSPQPGVPLPPPLAQVLGLAGFPWSPSLVPALPPSPWILSPPIGLPRLPVPYLPWGRSRRLAPGAGLLSWGPPPAGRGGQPLLVSRAIRQHSLALRPLHGLQSLGRTVLPSRSPRSWFSGLCRGTPGTGCAQPLLQATLRLDCARPLAGLVHSRRDAVREEGRWEGSDVAKPPLPSQLPPLPG